MDQLILFIYLLLFISTSYCFMEINTADSVAEKRLYLSKLTELYDSVGLDGQTLSNEIALQAMIMDNVNSKTTRPMQARGIDILSYDLISGDFTVTMSAQTQDSRHNMYKVTGTADLNTMTAVIDHIIDKDNSFIVFDQLGFNNGSDGIDELIKLERETKCKRNSESCEKGSVQVDAWLHEALQYQRLLSYDVPLNYVQFIGTHNSFNNKADGYGTGDFTLGKLLKIVSGGKWEFVWAQQWFTITDQLNMGVRYVMLDPVYFWGEMRLCHCGGGSVEWLDDAIKYIEKALNIHINFDSHDLGCMPYDRLFSSAIQEIYDWLTAPEHSNEFVMVYINDESSDSDWNMTGLIQNPVANITGNILFTPNIKQELFPNRWPSIKELITLGKRLMFTCTDRCDNDDIFLEMMVPNWDRDTVKYFQPYPKCSGYKSSDWYLVGGESQVVGPIYNGPMEEGIVIKENIADLLSCPLSVMLTDLLSPGLISAAVWSWNVGYSIQNVSNKSCPAMDRNGRWLTVSCSSVFYHCCVNSSNISTNYTISISSRPDTWSSPHCINDSSVFGLPRNGYHNHQLYLILVKHQLPYVWINVTKI